VEDDKVSLEELQEQLEEFEDFVQSTDIVYSFLIILTGFRPQWLNCKLFVSEYVTGYFLSNFAHVEKCILAYYLNFSLCLKRSIYQAIISSTSLSATAGRVPQTPMFSGIAYSCWNCVVCSQYLEIIHERSGRKTLGAWYFSIITQSMATSRNLDINYHTVTKYRMSTLYSYIFSFQTPNLLTCTYFLHAVCNFILSKQILRMFFHLHAIALNKRKMMLNNL
jgi:uncharacterized membrane protein (DUF485 family)